MSYEKQAQRQQPRQGHNRTSACDESAQRRDAMAREQYVRNEMVADPIVENSQGTHFVYDAKSDGETKQQSQSLDVFEMLTIPPFIKNGEPPSDGGRRPSIVTPRNPDDLKRWGALC